METSKNLKVMGWCAVGLTLFSFLSLFSLIRIHSSLTLKKNQLRSGLAALKRKENDTRKGLPASGTALSGTGFVTTAEIYRFVQEKATDSGVTLLHFTVPKITPEIREVPVELTLACNYPAFIFFLSKIDGDPAYCKPLRFNIVATHQPGATINATLQLRFFLKKGGEQ